MNAGVGLFPFFLNLFLTFSSFLSSPLLSVPPRQLISEHKKFYEYINPYTRKLESLTYKHLKQLPAHPPDDWQTPEEELFVEKPLAYPKLGSPEEEEATDGVAEVERILQMHTDSDGSVKYLVKVGRTHTETPTAAGRGGAERRESIPDLGCLVLARLCVCLCLSLQWKHSSSADNSWIKAKQILHCEELIAEFLETEANKKGGASKTKSVAAAKKTTANPAASSSQTKKSNSHAKKK